MPQPTKTEFAVSMSCKSCVNAVTKSLEGIEGIESFDVNLKNQQVVISSTLPVSKLKELIERTGKQAVVKGFGITNTSNLVAAVAAIDQSDKVKGVIRMVQATPDSCIVEGTLDGLTPGQKNTLCIHQLGDISDGCKSCGDIYAITEKFNKLSGKIETIDASEDGRATFYKEVANLNLADVIGRSIVVHEGELNSLNNENTQRIGCGIIARSAGIFQNAKMFCACDGVTIWDERNKPIAGSGRSNIEAPSAKM